MKFINPLYPIGLMSRALENWDPDFDFSNTVSGNLIDMYENSSDLVVEIEAPGYKKEDFKIKIDNDVLTVSAMVKKEEEQEKGKKYYKKMRMRSSLQTSVILPVSVQTDKSKASYENGVLVITLPKETKDKAKEIEVRLE